MLQQLINYIISNWVDWLFLVVTGSIGWGYRLLIKRQKAEEIRNTAICEGVQALLRDRIINVYNRSLEKGFCPIYERESLKRLYSAYHALGGNGIVTDLYNKVMNMTTERNG